MGRQLLPCLLTCHVYLLFWVLFTYLCRWKEMRKDWATTRWGPVLSLWTTTAGCITWLVPWTKAKNKMILAWQYIRLDQDQVKIPEHAHWWKSGIKIPIKLRENTCGSYFGSVFTLMVAHNLALFMTVLLIRTKRFMDFAAPTHSFAQCEYRYLTRHKLTQMCKMLLRLMGMRPHFHIGVCVCVCWKDSRLIAGETQVSEWIRTGGKQTLPVAKHSCTHAHFSLRHCHTHLHCRKKTRS